MDKFNEATRVQMPALVHLTRLGYTYFGKIHEEQAGTVYDQDTNILLEVFKEQFIKLNPEHKGDFHQVLQDIQDELNYDDLGKTFYRRLQSISPTRLIDFENISNNSFHFTAEFTCRNGDDNFRPDITLFVNGLPLAFIEVKKPNNIGGMREESKRMNDDRFPNKKFRRFINITQLMIFSNNMEYDQVELVPIQGAFYCTGGRKDVPFNCFREEQKANQDIAPFIANYPYQKIDPAIEKKIIYDFHNQVILQSPEYKTNLDLNSPTNRIITSMCSPERLMFILKYGIAYVKNMWEEDGEIKSIDEKHIMRYQQMFAALAVRNKIKEGITSGIIWHTQGSGKTALAYYLNSVLRDFYASVNKVAKFYFIVDRLDLLTQASQEFEARGLKVQTANSKSELMAQFQNQQSTEGSTGEAEVTVINIQKFAPSDKINLADYATNLQRIFILDEAHRSYRPGGSFLANLFDADPNSVKIALTGTPLLAEERASCKIFGDYISTYYYDRSIADGYTRKIIREEIETSYRDKINAAYEKLEVLIQKKDVRKEMIIEHDNFVKELLRYIIHDLSNFRIVQGDQSLGGMTICETSQQAIRLYELFNEIQEEYNAHLKTLRSKKKPLNLKAGLILYNSASKEEIQQTVQDFKKNQTIDILFVYNMLLTGFDAPRLKRLYFCRQMKDHNLLQAITRVNRPYKKVRFGYVIDFANIKKSFEETNQAYLEELNRFNTSIDLVAGESEINTFQSVMMSSDEIIEEMKDIRQVLFSYTYDNAEIFSSEISTEEDKTALLDLKKALITARDMGNMVKTFGDDKMKEEFAKVEIEKLPQLIGEVQRRISIINQKEAFDTTEETKLKINSAMAEIEFTFSNIGSEELKIASVDVLNDKWRSTIHTFLENFDQEDPEYITIKEAFEKRFKEHGFKVDSVAFFNEQSKALDDILVRLRALQVRNNALLHKYDGDAKFARIHKRIREENTKRKAEGSNPICSYRDEEIMIILKIIKEDVDQKVYDQNHILMRDEYFGSTVGKIIAERLRQFPNLNSNVKDWMFIESRIKNQYINQYNEIYNTAIA